MKKHNFQNLYGAKLSINSADSDEACEQDLPPTDIASTNLESKKKAQMASNLKSIEKQPKAINPNSTRAMARSNTNSKSMLIISDAFDVIPQKPTYPDDLPEDNVEAALYLMNKE